MQKSHKENLKKKTPNPSRIQYILSGAISLSLIVILLFLISYFDFQKRGAVIIGAPQVAGVQVQTQGAPLVYPEFDFEKKKITPEEAIIPIKDLDAKVASYSSIPLSKNRYTIVVYGDSMVSAMGENLEWLRSSLKKKYPNVIFDLYNYGMNDENLDVGFARFHKPLTYKSRNYPKIDELNPDIIIIGSYAYHPFNPYDRDQHWLGLTRLLDEAKTVQTNTYILVEIAPLKKEFAKGADGYNYSEAEALTESNHITEQLKNALSLSKALTIPAIDIYNKSFDGTDVNASLIDPNNHLYPSDNGQIVTADTIVDTIRIE